MRIIRWENKKNNYYFFKKESENQALLFFYKKILKKVHKIFGHIRKKLYLCIVIVRDNNHIIY